MTYEDNALPLTTPLSLNVQTLLEVTKEDHDAIMKHYGITEQSMLELVDIISEWYRKQPHLPQGDPVLCVTQHLMIGGFSVERTKRIIDRYISVRSKLPEIIFNRDPRDPELVNYIKRGFWTIVPKKTPKNYRIMILRFPFPEDYSMDNILKIFAMIAEYMLWNDYCLGYELAIDLSNVGKHLFVQLTPVMIAKIAHFATAFSGAKSKKIYLINLPSYFVPLYNLYKTFISQKIKDRFVLCNLEEFFKHFPEDILPSEYGGKEKSCLDIADEWLKTFQSDVWRNHLIEQDKMVTDESKRLVPDPMSDMFGVNGSFRKLTLD